MMNGFMHTLESYALPFTGGRMGASALVKLSLRRAGPGGERGDFLGTVGILLAVVVVVVVVLLVVSMVLLT